VVTAFEEGALLVEEQREGPIHRWQHTRPFEPREGGTRVTEAIEYEPPGGMLGLLLTAEAVEADLSRAYAWRAGKVIELLSPAPPSPPGPG
jgi:ligand-binding SRPBCC domain-containing protein